MGQDTSGKPQLGTPQLGSPYGSVSMLPIFGAAIPSAFVNAITSDQNSQAGVGQPLEHASRIDRHELESAVRPRRRRGARPPRRAAAKAAPHRRRRHQSGGTRPGPRTASRCWWIRCMNAEVSITGSAPRSAGQPALCGVRPAGVHHRAGNDSVRSPQNPNSSLSFDVSGERTKSSWRGGGDHHPRRRRRRHIEIDSGVTVNFVIEGGEGNDVINALATVTTASSGRWGRRGEGWFRLLRGRRRRQRHHQRARRRTQRAVRRRGQRSTGGQGIDYIDGAGEIFNIDG